MDEGIDEETDKEIELLRKKIMAVNNYLLGIFMEFFVEGFIKITFN